MRKKTYSAEQIGDSLYETIFNILDEFSQENDNVDILIGLSGSLLETIFSSQNDRKKRENFRKTVICFLEQLFDKAEQELSQEKSNDKENNGKIL